MPVGFERLIEPAGAPAQFGKAVKQKRISCVGGDGSPHQLDRPRFIPDVMRDECAQVERVGMIRLHREDLAAKLVGLRKAAGLAIAVGSRKHFGQGSSPARHGRRELEPVWSAGLALWIAA